VLSSFFDNTTVVAYEKEVYLPDCFRQEDGAITAVAQRISEIILQEDPKRLMWYDQALTRTGHLL